MSVYFLRYLPTAWWWGFKIISATEHSAQVHLPFSWRTRNPFRSIYFAALTGAGELSTGVLANLARLGRGEISMLVVSQQATFHKKATSGIIFTCDQGMHAFETVEKALLSGEPQTLEMTATGRNQGGDVVAVVTINWSFKLRLGK